MRYATEEERGDIYHCMRLAAEQALKSTCKKSLRGVIIVNRDIIVGKGYNKPTIPELCCSREKAIGNNQQNLCSAIHAEEMAILDAINSNSRIGLQRAKLYHIKVKDKKMQLASPPSCTICSRLILESGIAQVVLSHEQGYAIYNAKEFNQLSFQYFQNLK